MIEAVLFDMDGTLFDSEKIYARGWIYAGVPRELYLTFIGRNSDDINKRLIQNGFDPVPVRKRKDAYTEEHLPRELALKPGAKEALAYLKEHGYKTAIATASPLERARNFLAQTDFEGAFDTIVSGKGLKNGKPAPDIFLLTAKELGADPARCLVVEDSFNGIRAGHAAGMYTVMIPDQAEPDDEIRSVASGVLETLCDLPAFIESLQAYQTL